MTFTWTRTLLRCTACGASWETPKDEPHECAVMAARSQADALAEALEDLWEAGSWEAADETCTHKDNGGETCPPDDPECLPCVQRAALAKMEKALARSSSSTETEG